MALNECQYALISLMLIYLQFGLATDKLLPTQGISIGQTLTSPGQIFELGFFNPLNSRTRYIGIWYKKSPETIVWVANRENPLAASDQSVKLILNNDGNMRLLDGKQRMVWSTNFSDHLNNSIAALLDTGNFMIKDNTSDKVVWESFHHICDVFLSAMTFQISTKLGSYLLLNSWRSENDPAPGNFTLVLVPEAPATQSYIWKGSNIYWRTGPWNSFTFVGIPDLSTSYIDNFSMRVDRQAGILYISSNYNYDNLPPRIMKLFPDGSLRTLELQGNEWKVNFAAPDNECDVYGRCGPNAVCNPNPSPICSCVRGFIPKSVEEWGKGNWKEGCVSRTELLCSKNDAGNLTSENDEFLKLSRMKLPDSHKYLADKGLNGCQDWCLRNCSCSAFLYLDGAGCLVWTGDLTDLQKFSSSGQDLFLRLAHSELVETKRRTLIIALISSLAVVIVSLSTYLLCRCKIKKQAENSRNNSEELALKNSLEQVDTHELPTFEYEKIVAATSGFSTMNKIGEGGFGEVFKGKLQNGQEIAVKRLSSRTGQGINEFRNEILLISKLQHRNLVKILGCSIKGEEKLIIYEYLANRSLDTFLFDPLKKKQLNWALRFNLIQNVARGMSYLHKDSRLRVIHRDLKASNILLDHDMNPKISDFGLARSFQATQESANTLRVVGTFGYMSPEYAMRGIFSEKSDVFSFGVLMLEIVSGKKISSSSYTDEDQSLLTHAWRLWNESRGLELIDESMLEDYSDTQVLRCINVGLLCTQDHADDRPTMCSVVVMLSSTETLLPRPKKPAFDPQFQSRSSEIGSVYSVNGITVSEVEGR